MENIMDVQCNEVGFTAANVEALCRIGFSTKKLNRAGFIGEKGIGFKSVFKVADQVWITSGPYSFKFDATKPLGMIAPVWEERRGDQTIRSGTKLVLILKDASTEPHCATNCASWIQCFSYF